MFDCMIVLHAKLTPREEDILTWFARGKTRPEIAVILSLSETSVKTYAERARLKLNASTTTQATSLAVSLGLISPFKDMSWFHQPTHSL